MSASRPWFILAGGINGAGKSTFAQSRSTLQKLDAELDVEFEIINPDLVTKKLLAAHPGCRLEKPTCRPRWTAKSRYVH